MKKTFDVKGMHCKSCGMLIKDGLEDIGVKAMVSHVEGKMIAEWDESKVNEDEIVDVIKKEGFEVER